VLLRLPRKKANQKMNKIDDLRHCDIDTTEYEILVVDDSPTSLRLLTQILVLQGYCVRSAASGAEALEAVQESLPDLILLDVMMPDMNGFEVAERLQADPRSAGIPIVFVSALSDEDSKVRAFSSGGVDYVSKPLHINEVAVRVATHLQAREAMRRLVQQLAERERLIADLDTVNEKLKQQILEREAAQEAREASLKVMRQALDRAEALYRIARSLVTSDGIPDMLVSVSESLATALQADRIVILTLDTEKGEMTSIAGGGPGFQNGQVAFHEGSTYEELMEGLTGWVVKRTQPVISPKGKPDPRESIRVRQRREVARCGAIMMVPLYYLGRIMGTIAVINRPDESDFGEVELAQLSAIAGLLAVALANAHLSNETSYLKEFNEGIVQGVAGAILLMDAERRITFANSSARALLGYDLTSVLGKSHADFLPELELPVEDGKSGALISSTRFETVVYHRDGTSVPVLASTRPLYQGGQLMGSLIVLTDIAEIKAAEAKLRQYATDLRAQNAELDAFAHTVAHDLRGPLTGILGFTELLQVSAEDAQDPDLVEYARHIYRSSAKMNNIIDELLLLASVREVSDIPMRPLDMASIVRETQYRLSYLIEEYNAVVLTPPTWPPAVGYPQWIEEVWVNYLSNALKYGGWPEQQIPPRIELGFDMLSEGSNRVRFWVRDNGRGLTEQQQSQLFTPFERLHNVRAQGYGLGLSIVRRILEKLGGEVGVQSTPGEGSLFYFILSGE
jgi:PAS domain S-box-containing protein